MIILLRYLMVFFALCFIGIIVYIFVSKNKKIKNVVDPDGPTVLDQARDVANKSMLEKNVMKTAEEKLHNERKELEEFFPENREKKL